MPIYEVSKEVYDLAKKIAEGKMDYAPVVHGKWILTDFPDECTYKCSECNEYWIFLDGTPTDNGANYCPNCGAKMDQGDEA